MYFSDFYRKLLNFELTKAEVVEANINMSNIKFDNVNSFDKYYDHKLIQTAINKCRTKEIDVEYFSAWSNLYNWVINTTEWEDDEYRFINCIRADIAETLDAMSFLNEEDDIEQELYRYEGWNNFHYELYSSYKENMADWNVYYCGYEEHDCDVPTLFFVNKTAKVYAELWDGNDPEDIQETLKMLDVETYIAKKQELKEFGFIDLFDKQ